MVMHHRALGVAIAALTFFMLALAAWLWTGINQELAPESAVEIEIPRGSSSARIAEVLAAHGVIDSPLLFRIYLRLSGQGGALRSGYYRFERPASLRQVIDRLVRGDVLAFQVTVPEGLRTDEVLELLARQTGVELAQWQKALHELLPDGGEGRLLPETYQYTKPVDPKSILAAMIRAQEKVLDSLSHDEAERQRLRIIASIIEKETALPEERPLVSAVIHNRLRRHMPLQMDPTVIYGIWKTTGSFSGNIRKADLLRDTPWNTYTRKGLPPTPIGNPGADSLRAAARPADSDALYFVADGKGGHVFASSLAEHQANVRRWVRIERQMNRERSDRSKQQRQDHGHAGN